MFLFSLRLLSGAALVLLTLAGCFAPDPSKTEAARRIIEFTGYPTKLTWVQDTGDPRGGDYKGVGRHHRLIVLSTAEGAAPRVLVDEPERNFFRPMISPGGDWVVFSDHDRHTMAMVPFAGGPEVDLGPGRAIAVRRDASSGADWLYYMLRESENLQTILRRPLLAAPGEPEKLWQTEAFDWGSVSADGRMLVGKFGWPQIAMVDLQAKTMSALPDGCWPDISPDNQYLGWIFEGTHRSVTMVDLLQPELFRSVRINTHPEVAATRIYHPRWGNHPRFIAMNGPFRGQLWEHRSEVEIHVVRLDESLRQVEDSLRITENAAMDAMPDIWLDHGITWPGADEAREVARQMAGQAWPVERDHLFSFWKRQTADNGFVNLLTGVSSIGSVQARGQARISRQGLMDLSKGWFEAVLPSEALAKAIEPFGVLSMEMVVHGKDGAGSAHGVLLEVHDAGGKSRLLLNWGGDQIEAVARQGDRHQVLLRADLPATTRDFRHVLVQISDFHMQVFVDGNLVLFPELDGRVGPLSGWPAIRVNYGDSRGLPVELSHTAVRKYFLQGDEVVEAATTALASAAAIRFNPPPVLRIKGELLETSTIPSPEGIAPYRRALASSVYRVLEVLEGAYADEEIMVQHWVIMDGQVRADAARKPGETFVMQVEPVEANPQLRSEYTVMDVENLLLEPYYQADF